MDVYKGFTNIVLDESSSFLTTMHTPIGRYRWLRMPFGVSLGPEEYQRGQHEALEGLNGVVNKADDILVFGSGETIEEAERDHDIILWNLMLRCQEVNLKFSSMLRKLHQSHQGRESMVRRAPWFLYWPGM